MVDPSSMTARPMETRKGSDGEGDTANDWRRDSGTLRASSGAADDPAAITPRLPVPAPGARTVVTVGAVKVVGTGVAARALATFSRPPLTVLLFIDETLSTLPRIRSFTPPAPVAASPGFLASSNAAAPATCGAAIDVPLSWTTPSCGSAQVLQMLTPGAPRSTVVFP